MFLSLLSVFIKWIFLLFNSEKKEKQNREKLEKDRMEAELEKQQQEERERAKREVQEHFEESLLRLANQKVTLFSCNFSRHFP